MNALSWTAQILLAFDFTAAGCMKLFAFQKFNTTTEKNGSTGMGRSLVGIIGFAEIAGGIGIVAPMATNIAPGLTVIAALGLATVMLLTIAFHVRRREPPVAAAVLLLLSLFVATGRFA